RDRHDREGHGHGAEPAAIPSDLQDVPRVGPAVLQHLRRGRYLHHDAGPVRRADLEDDAGGGGTLMSLVNPSALLLAGLAIPILALYILKVRLRRAPVSTLLFWR